ncbi:carboxypeptidase-like regulatory domain-containing protein [uncultured Draconibacterium sp.]|uniref:carboxypeptidase-like regulatory domain-containing protein n=1 Tax=uncultured Draconibacterium sp. TaxID=1573823 RepID=UPI0029C69076|nr:carboxypeptidase-like regulatory domain-containing protein [uncultured Draconibacterium sp.]
MTDAERNAFEKELQKHPFEAEAMDGFESVSSSDFENDLNELTQKTGSKKQKRRMPYFAAAATILLLITSGIIWMQLDRQNPVEKVSEVKTDTIEEQASEPQEKQPAQALHENVAEIEISEEKRDVTEGKLAQKQESAAPKEEKVATTKNIQFEIIDDDIEIENLTENEIIPKPVPDVLPKHATETDDQVKVVTTHNRAKLAVAQAAQAENLNRDSLKGNIIRGQILADSDGMPIPGVSVVEKGTNNGTITDIEGNFQIELKNDSNPVVASFVGMESTEFHPQKDSDNIITLTDDVVGLSEVVVIGYGTQKKESVTGSTTIVNDEPLNSAAVPVCGISEYKVYLKDKAVLPADIETDKVVVKLRLTIESSGKILEFENLNDADARFFELAKEIVLDGPQWTPAYRNNRKVDSRVTLRVVFKKADD